MNVTRYPQARSNSLASRIGSAFVVALLFFAPESPAQAQEMPKDRAAKKKAIEAVERFDAENYSGAEALLHGTIIACGSDCSPSVIAGLSMYRGLSQSRLARTADARAAFKQTLLKDPTLPLDELRADAQSRSLYEEAQASLGADPTGPPILINVWRTEATSSPSPPPPVVQSTTSAPTVAPPPVAPAPVAPAVAAAPASATTPPATPPAPVVAPPEQNGPQPGTVAIHFVPKPGKKMQVTALGIPGATCDAPCELYLPPGEVSLKITGDAKFGAKIDVPTGESTYRIKNRRAGMFITGGIVLSVGVIGAAIVGARDPDNMTAAQAQTAMIQTFFFAGHAVVGGILILAAGNNKVKLLHSGPPTVGFGGGYLSEGGGVGAMTLRF